MLSIITKDDYDKMQANGSLGVVYEGVPIKGDFNAFKESRQKYFEQHNLNIDYVSSTFEGSVGLDPQATTIFQKCIDGLASSSNYYGLSAFVSSEDEKLISLQLFWNSVPAGQTVTIVDSTVIGAEVIDTSHPHKLYDKPEEFNDKDYTTILLKRNSPNDLVVLTLNTKPRVRMPAIKVKPVPPLYSCTPERLDHDPQTLKEFVYTEPFLTDDHLCCGKGPNGDRWVFKKVIPDEGVEISSVSCALLQPYSHIRLDDESGNGKIEGNTAICSGSKNGMAVNARMTVRGVRTYMRCTAIPWTSKEQEKEKAVVSVQ
jgi:hypothetical protein